MRVQSSLRKSDAKDLVFMSICMREGKALLGVKDIGMLVDILEEDVNREALGTCAKTGVNCIGEFCYVMGFHLGN